MAQIFTGLNNSYRGLANPGQSEVLALKPLVTSLRSADTSSFINSAYLIDLSDEAKTLSEYQQNKIRLNEIINNWQIRYTI